MNREFSEEQLDHIYPITHIGEKSASVVDVGEKVAEDYESEQIHTSKSMEYVTSRDLRIFDWYIGSLPSESKVFELGVGAGRTSRLLNQKGHFVYPTDISPAFVRTTRRSLLDQKYDINRTAFGVVDIQTAEIDDLLEFTGGRLDAVTLWGGVFNYLVDDVEKAMENISGLLNENGKLLLHVVADDPLPYRYSLDQLGYVPGYSSFHDTKSGITIIPGGERIPARYYSINQITSILHENQFDIDFSTYRGIGKYAMLYPKIPNANNVSKFIKIIKEQNPGLGDILNSNKGDLNRVWDIIRKADEMEGDDIINKGQTYFTLKAVRK